MDASVVKEMYTYLQIDAIKGEQGSKTILELCVDMTITGHFYDWSFFSLIR